MIFLLNTESKIGNIWAVHFSTQPSTPDFSTPDFSTSDPYGVEKCMVEKSGVDEAVQTLKAS